MVKLKDFAIERGVTDRQVQRLLKKYEAELAGQFERRGQNGTWLSDDACEFLVSKMRSNPVVVGDGEQYREMQRLREENEKLLREQTQLWQLLADREQQLRLAAEEKAEHAKLLAEADAKQLLLEQKEQEAADQRQRADAAEAEKLELAAQVKAMKEAGLIERLRGWK